MYIIIGLILGIPMLIGMVRVWYILVCWGEIHLKPLLGDRQGFILAGILLPLAFLISLGSAIVILGRESGAWLLGTFVVIFALYGLFTLYMRYLWR